MNFKYQISNIKFQIIGNWKLEIRNSLKRRNGFTLIELLIVIAIIGVLATLLLVNFIGVRQRARDGKRKADISEIQAALEQYRSDVGAYPTQLYSLKNSDGTYSLTNSTVTYMKAIPIDPLGNAAGFSGPSVGSTVGAYYYTSDGNSYTIIACLENSSDSQGVSAGGSNWPSGLADSSCSYNVGSNKFFVETNP